MKIPHPCGVESQALHLNPCFQRLKMPRATPGRGKLAARGVFTLRTCGMIPAIRWRRQGTPSQLHASPRLATPWASPKEHNVRLHGASHGIFFGLSSQFCRHIARNSTGQARGILWQFMLKLTHMRGRGIIGHSSFSFFLHKPSSSVTTGYPDIVSASKILSVTFESGTCCNSSRDNHRSSSDSAPRLRVPLCFEHS